MFGMITSAPTVQVLLSLLFWNKLKVVCYENKSLPNACAMHSIFVLGSLIHPESYFMHLIEGIFYVVPYNDW